MPNTVTIGPQWGDGGGGGESEYERIKPQKETDLGVAQTFFDP